jgi:hypothetical protein
MSNQPREHSRTLSHRCAVGRVQVDEAGILHGPSRLLEQIVDV